MRAYPRAKGVVTDGGGEHHYELTFHHGGEQLEIRDSERSMFQHLKMDTERMERGITHLRDRMHRLAPSMVRYYAAGGMLGGLGLSRVQPAFGFSPRRITLESILISTISSTSIISGTADSMACTARSPVGCERLVNGIPG
jgi:hypothetical protein